MDKGTSELIILVSIFFVLFEFKFIHKGILRQKGYKATTLQKQKNEAFSIAIKEPWRTKFCWAGIVQLLFIFLLIYLQLK